MRVIIKEAFVQTIGCWHELLVWLLTVVLFVPVRFMFKHNYLGSDVESRAGSVFYFLLLMALPPVLVEILGTEPELHTMAAFFFLGMLLLPVLGLIFRQKQNDLATTIYDPRGEANWNTENAIVLVGYVVECVQLCAFSFDPTIPYPEGISVPFRALLLDFGISGFATFYTAFGLVVVWLFLIAAVQTHEKSFVDAQEITIPWMSRCRRTYKTFKLPLLRYMLLLLGGGAYVVILKSMMSTLYCVKNPLIDQYVMDDSLTYGVGGEVVFNANDHLHVKCWHGAHRIHAILAFYALIFFFPTACLAPYGTDRRFIPHQLDIRLVPIYVFANNVLKSLLTGLVMFNRQNQDLALCCTLGISFLQMVLNSVYKPCCIPWVNTVRMSSYAIAAWTSLTSLYASHNGRQYGAAAWRPVFLLFSGWSAILLSVVWIERTRLQQLLYRTQSARPRSSGMSDQRAVEQICKPSMKQRVHIERALFAGFNITTLQHILDSLERDEFKASAGETALKLVRSGVVIKAAELLVDTIGVDTKQSMLRKKQTEVDAVSPGVAKDCVQFLTTFFRSLVVHSQQSSSGGKGLNGPESERLSWLLYSEQVFSLTQLIEKKGKLIGKTAEAFAKSYCDDLFEKDGGFLFEDCNSGGLMALVLELFVHSSQKRIVEVLNPLLEFIHLCLCWCAASRLQVVKSGEGEVLRALLHESRLGRKTASECLFLLAGCVENNGCCYQPQMFYAQLTHVCRHHVESRRFPVELDSAIHTLTLLAKHHLKTTSVYIVDGTYKGKHLRRLGVELCSFMKEIVQCDIVGAILSCITQNGHFNMPGVIEAIAELLKCYFFEKRSFSAINSELTDTDLLLHLKRYLVETDSNLKCVTAFILDAAMNYLDERRASEITNYCLKALLSHQINTREIMVAGFAHTGDTSLTPGMFHFVARIFGAMRADLHGTKLEAGIIPIVQAFANQSPLHQKSCIPLLTEVLVPLGQEATTISEIAAAQISRFVRKKQVSETYRYASVTGSLLFGLPLQKFWSERIEKEFLLRFVLLKQRRYRYDEQRAEKTVVYDVRRRAAEGHITPASLSYRHHRKWYTFASEIMSRKLRQEFAQLLKQQFDGTSVDLDVRRSTRAMLSPRQRVFKQVFMLITHNKVGYKGLVKSNYHPGIISKIRRNGNYDITYDDGTHEINVSPENIRSRRHICHGSRVDQFEEGDEIEADADVFARVIASCEAWVIGAAFLVKKKAFLHLLRVTHCLNSQTNNVADVLPNKGVLGLNESLPKLFESVGYKQLSACESISIDNWQLRPSHLKNEKKLETLVSGVLTEQSKRKIAQEWQKARSKCPCEKANVPCTCGHQQLRILTQFRHVVKLVPGVPETNPPEESLQYFAQDSGKL
jgi:hypothetical protein